MNSTTRDMLETLSLPIPIPQSVRETLHQQIMPCTEIALEKRTRTLDNMLAVWAVNYYLETLCGIATSPRTSTSLNPIFALLEDTADLELPNLGHLACRPIHPQETVCSVPEPADHDRIGYVVVEIDTSQQQATILGFTPVAHDSIQLSDLKSPEGLLEHLATLKQKTSIQQLQDWFKRHFETAIEQGWETVETIRQKIQQDLQPAAAYLSNTSAPPSANPAAITSMIQLLKTNPDLPTQESAIQILGEIGSGSPEATQILTHFLETTPNDNLRWQAALSLAKVAPNHPKAAISRAKLLNLGVQLANQKVALIGTLVADNQTTTTIFFQVHSFHRHQTLPPGLKLSILDNSQTVIQSVASRQDEQGRGIDYSINLLWQISSHCTFCVRVEIGNVKFEQYFAI